LRVPIAMRRFYKPSLWIPQLFLLANPNLHHGLLGRFRRAESRFHFKGRRAPKAAAKGYVVADHGLISRSYNVFLETISFTPILPWNNQDRSCG
jgi:hypothetical protein